MEKHIKIIMLLIIVLLISNNSNSQETIFLNECKIITIDSNSYFPNYYIIKVLTNKGIIVMLSYNEKTNPNVNGDKIAINNKYDFEILTLDSIPIIKKDTAYFKFPNFRGGNGKSKILDDDKTVIVFEDYNYKPFKSLNLVGLYYKSAFKKSNSH